MDTSETYYNMCYEAFPEDREEGNCLKTQDQIQGMLPFGNLAPHALLLCFWNFVDKDIDHRFVYTSMEQLWLAFYMKEKHNKTWDGEKWITLRNT